MLICKYKSRRWISGLKTNLGFSEKLSCSFLLFQRDSRNWNWNRKGRVKTQYRKLLKEVMELWKKEAYATRNENYSSSRQYLGPLEWATDMHLITWDGSKSHCKVTFIWKWKDYISRPKESLMNLLYLSVSGHSVHVGKLTHVSPTFPIGVLYILLDTVCYVNEKRCD